MGLFGSKRQTYVVPPEYCCPTQCCGSATALQPPCPQVPFIPPPPQQIVPIYIPQIIPVPQAPICPKPQQQFPIQENYGLRLLFCFHLKNFNYVCRWDLEEADLLNTFLIHATADVAVNRNQYVSNAINLKHLLSISQSSYRRAAVALNQGAAADLLKEKWYLYPIPDALTNA
ncbi:hypothetical protein ACOME3_002899 [Neoechinorhynchus agilis]